MRFVFFAASSVARLLSVDLWQEDDGGGISGGWFQFPGECWSVVPNRAAQATSSSLPGAVLFSEAYYY